MLEYIKKTAIVASITAGAVVIMYFVFRSTGLSPQATNFYLIMLSMFIGTSIMQYDLLQDALAELRGQLNKDLTPKAYNAASVTAPSNNNRYSGYYLKESILHESEIAFYKTLTQVCHSGYIICPQVRVADVIGTKAWFWDKYEYSQKNHIDFLLVEKSTLKPKLAIELDGKSHNSWKSFMCDKFKEELCQSCGLKFMRVGVAPEYSFRKLELDIQQALNN